MQKKNSRRKKLGKMTNKVRMEDTGKSGIEDLSNGFKKQCNDSQSDVFKFSTQKLMGERD
jgi:hypothetical protein